MYLKLIIAAFTFIIVMNPQLESAAVPVSQPTLNTPQIGGQPQDNYAGTSLGDDLLNEMDHQHQTLSQRILDFSEEIDTFFISDDLESRVNYSYIQLGYRYTRYVDNPYQLDPIFTAHLHLPRTQNRLTLEMSNNNPFASVNDSATNTTTDTTNPADPGEVDQALNISLGYARKVAQLLNAKLSGGVRLAGDKLKLFVNLQLYKEFFFEKWSLQLSEDLYRDNLIFSRATTQILFERKISADQLFRSISRNIYYKDLGYSQSQQTFSVLDQLSERDALIYQVGSMWEKQHNLWSYQLENYYAMVSYSRKIYKDWLFLAISPQVQYARSEDFHPTPLIALQLSAFFGNNK